MELEAQMRGNAAAEGVSGAVWQSEFNAYAEGLEPAERRLAAAIRACEERQVKMLQRTVSSAVGRAIVTAQEAAKSDDLIEIDLASRHLSPKATEMEKLATRTGGEASDQDKERLREAEKSLRKLEARRQELEEDPNVGSSPQLASHPRPPPPNEAPRRVLSGRRPDPRGHYDRTVVGASQRA
jgi:hypothetical protein